MRGCWRSTGGRHVDNSSKFTAIEWCAGYGGIHLGLKRAIPNLRVIAYGEIEGFATANLVAKMEAGLLDPAPLWTDIKTFPCEAFRDRVDLLVAGYPCQPFSAAGKRLGAEDPRHLWPHIARAIGIIRPRLCFFENVEGHISLGLREVIGDLGAIGYTAAWGIFSASEVGAPHRRNRVFILAVSNSLGGAAGVSRSLAWNERIAGEFDHGGGEIMGNPSSQGYARPAWSGSECSQGQSIGHSPESNGCVWPSRPGEPQHAWEPPRVVANNHRPHAGHGEQRLERTHRDLSGGCGEAMGNAQQFLLPASREHGAMDETSGIPADGKGCEPSQADTVAGSTRKREGDGGNASEFSETKPSVGRDADGASDWMDYAELCISCDNRTDELRLLGNGVVPATAERAFRTLWEELSK